jgi:hypothetical protein
VNPPTDVIDPFGVVSTTSLAPAVVAGVVTVTELAEFTVMDVPETPPKVTADVPVRLVPVIVTESPPFVDPLEGEISTMVGAVFTTAAAVSRPGPH